MDAIESWGGGSADRFVEIVDSRRVREDEAICRRNRERIKLEGREMEEEMEEEEERRRGSTDFGNHVVSKVSSVKEEVKNMFGYRGVGEEGGEGGWRNEGVAEFREGLTFDELERARVGGSGSMEKGRRDIRQREATTSGGRKVGKDMRKRMKEERRRTEWS